MTAHAAASDIRADRKARGGTVGAHWFVPVTTPHGLSVAIGHREERINRYRAPADVGVGSLLVGGPLHQFAVHLAQSPAEQSLLPLDAAPRFRGLLVEFEGVATQKRHDDHIVNGPRNDP